MYLKDPGRQKPPRTLFKPPPIDTPANCHAESIR